MRMENLAKFQGFIHDPETHIWEIRALYQEMMLDIPRIGQFIGQLAEAAAQNPKAKLAHVRYEQSYDVLMALALILNSIMRVYDPDDITLAGECMIFCARLIAQAKEKMAFMPFGGSYIPICLVSVWAATEDPSQRAEVEALMKIYQISHPQISWLVYAEWFKNKYDCLRVRLSMSYLIDPTLDMPDDPISRAEDLAQGVRAAGSCTIL
jgi:hypothetical protein